MKDFATVVATMATIEIIEMAFGRTVGMAVAITALIACVLFLWHAGKDAA